MKRLVARLPHCLGRTRVLLGASLCLFIFSVGGCSEEPPPDPVFVPAQFAVTESADGFAVSGAEPGSPRKLLRFAAVSPNFQAAAHGKRNGPILSDRSLLSG